MKMIGHQAISVNLPIGFLACLGQGSDEVLSINIILENVLPPISLAHDVIFGSWKFYPHFSWHATAWKAEKQLNFK
jgi:hypothetical protein